MKLSFGAILSESFGFFFARLGLFFHLVTIPWILSLALRIFTSAVTEQTLLTVLAEKAIDVIPTIMFQVAWMRLVLLGPERVERLPGLGWSRRETAFLLHLLKVAGVTFALIVAFTLTVGTIDPTMLGDAAANPDLMRREAMAAPLGTGFIVSALLALRVSFGLAATTVDLPWSPRRSWAYGRGNSWTIIGSLFVVLFAGAVGTSVAVIVPLALMRNLGADTAAAVVTWTIAILVSYGSAALVATTQAVIWRRLTAWREGVPLA
ncbi:hypothetical protein [Reyranella sp.]|uniref:hypothetical protein n=1 Tax=Reyranella sp. TaxID=1929291 RepID=UPI003D0E8C98